jgi:hypothetical protein
MNIRRIFKLLIDKDYYAFSTIMVLISIFSFYHYYSKDTAWNENDLIHLQGRIKNFSFNEGGRSKIYYFWLDKYDCTFQIPADFVDLFDNDFFRNTVNSNSKLDIFVSKHNVEYLNQDRRIFVFQIQNQKGIYLSMKDTIKRSTQPTDIYAGFAFLIVGFIYFFIRRFYWKPRYLNANI